MRSAVVLHSFAFIPRVKGKEMVNPRIKTWKSFLYLNSLIFVLESFRLPALKWFHIVPGKHRKRDVATVFAYSHLNTPFDQWECALCLKYFIERFPFECCKTKTKTKTKTKVITLANHKEHRQYSEPIKTRSNYMWLTQSAASNDTIGHVRYINILAWLRGFRVKIANFSSFFCLSIPKGDLDTKKTTPNIEVWPESLGAM